MKDKDRVVKPLLLIDKIKLFIKSIGANKKEYWWDENGVKHTKLIIKRMK